MDRRPDSLSAPIVLGNSSPYAVPEPGGLVTIFLIVASSSSSIEAAIDAPADGKLSASGRRSSLTQYRRVQAAEFEYPVDVDGLPLC